MKKLLWKKTLNILDEIETQNIQVAQLYDNLAQAVKDKGISCDSADLAAFISYLLRFGLIKNTNCGIDLSPSATIFARAESYSRLESLAIFECFYRHEKTREVWKNAVHQKCSINSLLMNTDPFSYKLLMETALIYDHKHQYWISDRYFHELCKIMEEVDCGEAPLLSITLCCAYASTIVDHQKPGILYKNEDLSLVPYPDLSMILAAIPRRGVPCDRDETRKLQSFYKDTLFHEYEHVCPICGIDLPHMLIASHIKPFRECAHIYEAIDHHNGILLCRNHDYLFDQGYISFSDQGALIMNRDFSGNDSLTPYHLPPNFVLPRQYLTNSRRLFLDYHRQHIFKG